MTNQRPEPRGICKAGAQLLKKQQSGRIGQRERDAVLNGPCGMINPLECRVHAAVVIGREWDAAEGRLFS